MRRLQGTFFTGLIILLPLVVALWVGGWLLNLFSGWEVELLNRWSVMPPEPPFYWNALLQLIAFALTCLVILMVGMLARSFIGRRLFGWVDMGMERLPVIGSIYDATRKLLNAFKGGPSQFQDVVLVAFPHAESKALGFVSNRFPASDGNAAQQLAVFVPASPNPTSGFIMLVPETAVEYLEMSIEEGFKFILSGGIAVDAKQFKRRPPPIARSPAT